ncbi:MAG: hypothetical protein ACRDSN_21335 [Pseudonocardiaceae bacterium]
MTVSAARFRLGGDVDMPPVVERLLLSVIQDGFVLYCCGGRAEPSALVASYEWGQYVDTVVIRGVDRVTAARVPKGAGVDVLVPEVVVWAYQGHAEWALWTLLDLVHPRHPEAPTVAHLAPRSLHVPRSEQRPLTIRLPSPARAGMRATRLTAAMTTAGM